MIPNVFLLIKNHPMTVELTFCILYCKFVHLPDICAYYQTALFHIEIAPEKVAECQRHFCVAARTAQLSRSW